jgi:hypothetical protein
MSAAKKLSISAPVDNTQLAALVTDLETKEQAVSDARDALATATSASTSADAATVAAAATANTAHDAQSQAVAALVSYVQGLA